ncbi:DUF2274 domain-containing protein [Burkholderia ubonensis]|uniref:DUF2274 domain-containing protein n=1 Tax=Burkholderia ubonensis TaxID=101571 RepID=UPI00075CAF17|nr:DUF2274 domain-containing protein [Burkholderia ubonensis]KVP16928.1 hypothetical protein WJ84_01250 [Burkholderia ubonensis]KVP39948.1 hypothetical protein WJ87_07120 [Burkholderia ubonensis]
MKLSRIPGHEPTVKHSFAFKQSTTALLQQYQEMYSSVTGAEVSLKDIVEQMLLDFMADDKTFQKELKKPAASAQAPSAPAAPAAPVAPHHHHGGSERGVGGEAANI